MAARLEGRPARDLYHSALEVCVPHGRFVIEMAPVPDSPVRLTEDASLAERVLELVQVAPTPVWGRDELRTGEMWNSNSLISWVIARSGLDVDSVQPPPGGRAPGWRAGIVVAYRQPLEPAKGSELD